MTTSRLLVLSADENTLDRRIANQVCSLAEAGYQVTLWMIIPNTFVPEQVRSCVDLRIGKTVDRGGVRTAITAYVRGRPKLLALYHWLSSFRDARAFWSKLVPVAELPKADMIIANDMPCLIPAVEYASLNDAAVLFDAHEIYEAQTDAIYSRRLRTHWLEIAREYAVKAGAVITVNELIAQELQSRYGLMDTPGAVSNACRYLPADTLQPTRLHELSQLPQKQLLVCSGEVRPGRQLEEFMQALPYLADTDIGLVFLGHCSNDYAQQLRGLARSLGIFDRFSVGVAVPSDELAAILSGASLGLISNRGDGPNNQLGGPNRLFEYIQARLPILAFEHQGIEQVLNVAGTGRVERWSGPAELGKSIERMLAGEPFVAPETLEQAAQRFCWENEQQTLLEYVGALLKRAEAC